MLLKKPVKKFGAEYWALSGSNLPWRPWSFQTSVQSNKHLQTLQSDKSDRKIFFWWTWNAASAKKSAINGHCSRTTTRDSGTAKARVFSRVKNPSKLKLSPIRLRCKQRNGKAAEISPLTQSKFWPKIFSLICFNVFYLFIVV